jgi:hypothetical protein
MTASTLPVLSKLCTCPRPTNPAWPALSWWALAQLRQLLVALNGCTFVRGYRDQTGQAPVIAEVAPVSGV